MEQTITYQVLMREHRQRIRELRDNFREAGEDMAYGALQDTEGVLNDLRWLRADETLGLRLAFGRGCVEKLCKRYGVTPDTIRRRCLLAYHIPEKMRHRDVPLYVYEAAIRLQREDKTGMDALKTYLDEGRTEGDAYRKLRAAAGKPAYDILIHDEMTVGQLIAALVKLDTEGPIEARVRRKRDVSDG